jgi:hypothetical protein
MWNLLLRQEKRCIFYAIVFCQLCRFLWENLIKTACICISVTLPVEGQLGQLREQLNKVEQVIVQQNTTAGNTETENMAMAV